MVRKLGRIDPNGFAPRVDFYHALYHLVAYWAALMVTLGLLISIGVNVSTTSMRLEGIRRNFCLIAVIATLMGSWFILWRVYSFSALIITMLPSDYTEKLTPFRPSPLFHGVVVLGTCLIGGFTLAVLFWPQASAPRSGVVAALKRRAG